MVRVVDCLGAVSLLIAAGCGTRGFEPDAEFDWSSAGASAIAASGDAAHGGSASGGHAAKSSGAAGSGGTGLGGGGSGGTGLGGGSGGLVDSTTGCDLPWWGAPLAGHPGVTTCTDFYNPAMMAYGQSEVPECTRITGPVNESGSGTVTECCYLVDVTECEGDGSIGNWCVELPYFGSGAGPIAVPETLEPIACTDEVDFQPPVSVSDAASRLKGLWSACGPTPGGFAGNTVLFQADGSFQILNAEADGTLKPAPGCLQAGLWGFLHSTGQLNMHMDDWTNMSFVSFAGPDMLKLRDVVFIRRSPR